MLEKDISHILLELQKKSQHSCNHYVINSYSGLTVTLKVSSYLCHRVTLWQVVKVAEGAKAGVDRS